MIPADYPQVSVRRKVQLLPWFIIAVIVLNALHMLPGQGEESPKPRRGGGAVHQPNPTAAARDDIPAGYLALYLAAVKQRCPGLSWTILAGIGKVESNHGRANLPGVRSGLNSAGCCAGPMQFNLTDGPPSTWATYGRGSPYDPRNAIPAAARKLCADGAARSGGLVPAVAGYYGGTTANPPTAAYVAHVRCAARAYGAGTVRDLTRCFA
ncbi:MAG TPA: hypothetical protein VGM21_16040 [Actinomycetota bacterium]|jgi:hypothetical protein